MIRRRRLGVAAALSVVAINACSEEPTKPQPVEEASSAPSRAGWLMVPPASGHPQELAIDRGRDGRLEPRRLLADSRRRITLELPESGDAWARLRDERTALEVGFRLQDRPSGLARPMGDVIDYTPPEGANAHVALRAHALGFEQYVQLSARESEPRLSYTVTLGNVASLRAGRDVVEYLDGRGFARIRGSRPWVLDAKGQRRLADLRVSRCVAGTLRADAAEPITAKPNGGDCRVDVTWDDSGLFYPLMLNPPWESTASLVQGRFFHSATVVEDQVVVIGGYGEQGALQSVEAYDAVEETWTPWPPLPEPRAQHTATALSGNRILVVGGYDASGKPLTSTLIGTKAGWGFPSDLKFARAEHVAVTMPGFPDKVVVVGGGVAEPEIFDPLAADASLAWTAGKPSKVARYGHAAAGLPGRYVLVTGGSLNPYPNEGWLDTVESYDEWHDQWHDEKPMSALRAGHSATALGGERVLVMGGAKGAEVFDQGEWIQSDDPPPTRQYHSALLLPSDDGEERVIVAGGVLNKLPQPSTAYFVPENNNWRTLPATLDPTRFGHPMSLLSQGRLVVAGGRQGFGSALKNTNDVLALSAGQPCTSSPQCLSGSCEDGVCCKTACEGACAACSVAAGSSTDGTCEAIPAGQTCSESKQTCVNDGLCDGKELECPAQTPVDDDTPCDDGDPSTARDSCRAGVCTGASDGGGGGEGGAHDDAGAGTGGEAGESAGRGGAGGGPTRSTVPAGANPFSCQLRGAPYGGSAALFLLALALLRRARKPGRQS
ncbi:MAG: kelch repeat-containing protein [Myxococcales bacterium]